MNHLVSQPCHPFGEERYCNYVTHECGCRTRFDTYNWCSELTCMCADHQNAEAFG